MFTIRDFLEIFTFEDEVLFRVYDLSLDEEIFSGSIEDCEEDLLEQEICSIDNIYKVDFDGYITINIDETIF